MFATDSAFAALKSDGSVVTWGDPSYGGNSSSVAAQLTNGVVSFADPFRDDRLTTNRPPAIAGVTLSSPSTSTGALMGTVKASDPDGDKMTYTATTSTKGAVAISTAGVFTYTPDGGGSACGGQDRGGGNGQG